MKTPREKYLNDPQYRMIVDQLVSLIYKCHFTPSELREAAILASIIYEEARVRHISLKPPEEVNSALDTLYKWTDK